MSFARVSAGRRSARFLAVMPVSSIPMMMIPISVAMMMMVMMMITVAAVTMLRRRPFVRVLEVRGIDDAFRRMRTRLVIFEAVEVAELLATVRLGALEVLTAAGNGRRFGTFARVEAEALGERGVVVFRVRTSGFTFGG